MTNITTTETTQLKTIARHYIANVKTLVEYLSETIDSIGERYGMPTGAYSDGAPEDLEPLADYTYFQLEDVAAYSEEADYNNEIEAMFDEIWGWVFVPAGHLETLLYCTEPKDLPGADWARKLTTSGCNCDDCECDKTFACGRDCNCRYCYCSETYADYEMSLVTNFWNGLGFGVYDFLGGDNTNPAVAILGDDPLATLRREGAEALTAKLDKAMSVEALTAYIAPMVTDLKETLARLTGKN